MKMVWRIALHHSSLDTGQRRRVEKAMFAGRLKASFASSTLDLGIDWGDVDLIINIGGKPPYSTNRPSQSSLTSPPGGYSFQPIDLKFWNAGPRSMRHEPVHKIRQCLGSALWMGSRSTWSERLLTDLYQEIITAAPYEHLSRRFRRDVGVWGDRRLCPEELRTLCPRATSLRRALITGWLTLQARRMLRRRCFAADGSCCVLPAFGAYAGGLVRSMPFQPLFSSQGFTAYVLDWERVFSALATAVWRIRG